MPAGRDLRPRSRQNFPRRTCTKPLPASFRVGSKPAERIPESLGTTPHAKPSWLRRCEGSCPGRRRLKLDSRRLRLWPEKLQPEKLRSVQTGFVPAELVTAE